MDEFDLEARKQWWSLQPVAKVDVPDVKKENWPSGDSDRFVLAALEAKGWEPAEPATRTSWLRRVTYDLTGLPPTPDEVQAFLGDEASDARERVVARLLDSKHFGEQWARHWMDLVRYAETKAFEADYPMPNVYAYRDYLIRAFNNDVPYDQLLREAIAGDLLEPRLNGETGINESVIGPGYLYLTDGQHGPPDVHADEARIFDDMIDVVGKAFLAQTLSCARCHDHKFDAITMSDYYSLYGVIASSRIDYADVNPPGDQEMARRELREQKAVIRRELADLLAGDLESVADDLAAVRGGMPTTPQQKRWAEALEKKPNGVMKAMASLLAEDASADQWESLHGESLSGKRAEVPSIGKLSRASFGEWVPSGRGYEQGPRPPGDFVVPHEGDQAVVTFVGGRPAAGHLASRFAGSLKSPTFTIDGRRVSVRAKGKNVRVSLYVRHYELVGRGPTTGGTTKVLNNDNWETVTFKTDLWIGEKAYIEIQHNGGEVEFQWATKGHTDGSYAVLDAATNNEPLPTVPGPGLLLDIIGPAPSSEDFLAHLAGVISALPAAWSDGNLTVNQSDLLESLRAAGVFDFRLGRSDGLRGAVETFRKLQGRLPVPRYVRSLSDGRGEDEPIYIRGSHKNLSAESNPRHFMDGIDGAPFKGKGSGRREWAEALVARDNPLTARVITNRIWHYLFGRGIVASVDDFGQMGDRPSHPELLDFLAGRFMETGWSMKGLIRELVLSSTYGMSSKASLVSRIEDPNNVLLQHMPIRRLQAEAIRDTLLAVSGQLDPKHFGPSIGGGGNRRSVYIQLKRRYMPEFLMTFDMPNATETFGRRNTTAGPAQSLALMNSDLVWNAADHWARRVLEKEGSGFENRIDSLHWRAFGRGATDAELAWARRILEDHEADEASAESDHGLWKELCHTMLNRKELIYVY